jgi:hypothetical protein
MLALDGCPISSLDLRRCGSLLNTEDFVGIEPS